MSAADLGRHKWVLFLDSPIAVLEDYGLSTKAISILEERTGWIYIHQLQTVSPEELEGIRDLGRIYRAALRDALDRYWRAIDAGQRH